MVVEAAAEGGKQHGFAIDGQGIADVKPGQPLPRSVFFIDHRVNAGHLFAFSDQITAIRSWPQSWGLQALNTCRGFATQFHRLRGRTGAAGGHPVRAADGL